MKLRSFLGGGLLLRRLATELRELRRLHLRQTLALERLAEHFAPPLTPLKAEPSILADTGLSFLDADEMMLALDYIEQSGREGGRIPSEEEVLTYLADEETIDLQQRLREREIELARRVRDR